MKQVFLFIVFLLCAAIALSQNYSLKDPSFISTFKTSVFRFKDVKPVASKHWRLVAANAITHVIKHTEEEIKAFGKYTDSLNRFLSDSVIYMQTICEAKAQITFCECLLKNYIRTDKQHFCDSIKQRQIASSCSNIELKNFPEDLIEKMWDDFRYQCKFNIVYSYSSSIKIEKKTNKEIACGIKGFGTWCPPNGCGWIIFHYKDGQVITVGDISGLLQFLGKIDNPFKASLLITATQFGDSGPYPIENRGIKYLKKGDKFFFVERLRLSDCPIQYFDCLISVSEDGKVELIDKVKVGEDNKICI